MRNFATAVAAGLLLTAFAVRAFSTTVFNNRYPVMLGLAEMLVLLVVLPLAFILRHREVKSRATFPLLLFVLSYTGLFLALCLTDGFFSSHRWDFDVYFQGAQNLYMGRGGPYNVRGSINFPAIDYPLFYVLSLLSGGDSTGAYRLFHTVNSVVLLLSLALAIRLSDISFKSLGKEEWVLFSLAAAIALIPCLVSNELGQTSLLVLLMVTLVLSLLGRADWTSRALLGLALCLACFIKVYHVLLVVFFVLKYLMGVRLRTPAEHALKIILSFSAAALVVILLSLVLPGGVTLQTYRDFFLVANRWVNAELSRLSADGHPFPWNFSLIYHIAAVLRLGGPIFILLSLSFISAGCIINYVAFLRHSKPDALSLYEFLPFVIMTVMCSPLSYHHYLSWLLPVFLLLFAEIFVKRPKSYREGFRASFFVSMALLCVGGVFSSAFEFYTLGLILLYGMAVIVARRRVVHGVNAYAASVERQD